MKTISILFIMLSLCLVSCEDCDQVAATAKAEAEAAAAAHDEVIKAAINDIVAGWNTPGESKFGSQSVDGLVRTSQGKQESASRAEYEANMKVFHTGFPDFKVAIKNMVVHGNKAFIEWNVTGTNTGPFNGNPPTKKKVDVNGFSVWEFNDEGMAVREDAYWDNAVMLTQLGYTMTPPKAKAK